MPIKTSQNEFITTNRNPVSSINDRNYNMPLSKCENNESMQFERESENIDDEYDSQSYDDIQNTAESDIQDKASIMTIKALSGNLLYFIQFF